MNRIVSCALICGLSLLLMGAAPQAGTIRRVYNLTLTNPDTEYSQVIEGRVSQVTIQCRNDADVKLAFRAGQSGTTYFTIKSGNAYYEQIVTAPDITVYCQSTTGGVVVEILTWSAD